MFFFLFFFLFILFVIAATCNGVKCLNGLTCIEDQYSMPHCIACKIECPQDDCDNDVVDATKAVCGADGKTYKSVCDINRMICKIGRSIGVAYPGPCRGKLIKCKPLLFLFVSLYLCMYI